MAVSGKTEAPHEIPYFLGSDAPPDIGDVTKAMADRLHERLDDIAPGQLTPPGGEGDDGKLLIVNSGAPAFAAMKGDATLAEDGTLTIGVKKIVTEMLADLGVTTAKLNNSAVTEGKVADKAISLAKLAEALGLPESYLAEAVQTKLNNERTPVDGSVTSAKLATSAKRLFPQLANPGADRIMNWGQNIVFASGQQVGALTVAHGLGKTPGAVVGSCDSRDINVSTPAGSYTDTHFKLEIRDITGTDLANHNCMWIAIG